MHDRADKRVSSFYRQLPPCFVANAGLESKCNQNGTRAARLAGQSLKGTGHDRCASFREFVDNRVYGFSLNVRDMDEA